MRRKKFIEQVAGRLFMLLSGNFEVRSNGDMLELLSGGQLVSSLAISDHDVNNDNPELIAGYWFGTM